MGTTAFLVHILLRPKVYFSNPERRKAFIEQPSIIVCNHTSHFDGPVINTVFRKNVIHNLAAKDRFEQKNFGFFLRHTGCIPIDRQNADTSWIHSALNVLNVQKECVAIYPEGRHGEHRKQLPFHSGVTMLAALAQVPIVLVYVDGPLHLAGKRARLIVGEPFRLDPPAAGISADYVEAQTALLQEKMVVLMNELIDKL